MMKTIAAHPTPRVRWSQKRIFRTVIESAYRTPLRVIPEGGWK
jgi:hypothetical protein